MKTFFALAFASLIALLPFQAYGQASVNAFGIYTQNFDGMTITGTSMTWANNSTIPGWYAYQSSTTSTPITQLETPGSRNFAWYGTSQDYAIGSQYDNSGGAVYFGVRLVNATGAQVNNFYVSYLGEQWRRAYNLVQHVDSLAFSYQIFDAAAGSLTAPNWISVSSLDFISPNATVSNPATLDGNAASNSVMLYSLVTGITLNEGQELWLRWAASDRINFSDHALAIDDLTVTFNAVPEPASCAALAALMAVSVAGLRRKRRA